MTEVPALGRCLNCAAPLQGPFCAACGQRAVPPDPTVRELAGDAWQELSGYDGRIMATIRGLLRPGFLTREYLGGRRSRYLPPVRVYLILSVVYFLVAAAAPNPGAGTTVQTPGPGGVRISVGGQGGMPELSEDERVALLAQAGRAPRVLRPLLRAIATDPSGFRARVLINMPRVFFALLPVFAALVALCYRGRTFPAALVFAAHVHACAFVLLTFAEVAKFPNSAPLALVAGAAALGGLLLYGLLALRAVFGGGWPSTIAKALVIGVLYLVVSVPAMFLMLLWSSWV